jgi:conjugal transfer pilus assembly protein TraU
VRQGQSNFSVFKLAYFLQENKWINFTNKMISKTKDRILLRVFKGPKGLSLLDKLKLFLLSRRVFRLKRLTIANKTKPIKMRLFSRAKYWGFEKKENKLEKTFIRGFAKQLFVYSILLLFAVQEIQANCRGRFVNPLTDICWSCLFPITIGGMNVTGGGYEDTPNPRTFSCLCPRGPLKIPTPGVPVSFWEPARLVDVTRTPYCLINMGGIQMAGGNRMQGRGSVADKGHSGGLKRSFYQVHWYVYPVIYWLELLTDFICLEKASFDVAYISEVDVLWNDEETGFILNPEAVLFGNPIAQSACAADCGLASVGFSNDALFWCGGCQWSLYPFTGSIPAHVGGVQASLLATMKMMPGYIDNFCCMGIWEEKGNVKNTPCRLLKRPNTKHKWFIPLLQQDEEGVILWVEVKHCGLQAVSFLIKEKTLAI